MGCGAVSGGLIRVIAVAVISVATYACSSPGPAMLDAERSDARVNETLAAVNTARESAVEDVAGVRTAPTTSMVSDASDPQASILRDGRVTFTEYEASVLAHLACLQRSGVRTTGPSPAQAGRTLTWTMTPPTGMSDEEFLSIEGECLGEYLDEVEEAFMESVQPDEQTLRQYAKDLSDCLVDAGAELEEGLTEQEIIPMMNELMTAGDSEVTTGEVFACFDLYALSVSRAGG